MASSSPQKRLKSTVANTLISDTTNGQIALTSTTQFFETSAGDAKRLTDGVALKGTTEENNNVILPWLGYGTYKLGKNIARSSTLEAIRQGYRCIDTAFIYGGETTEKEVGLAIQDSLNEKIIDDRSSLFVITKHWRKYHGYELTKECLRLSLKRLSLQYIDLWLMHWPGPAWNTMNRRKDNIEKYGPWHYAVHSQQDLPSLRAETWRAMEDAMKEGKVKSIGVCNFTIEHLKLLKQTATFWPPSVNQIECHPLFPQNELLEYCAQEGIVVQAYSSLGGQDAGKKFWKTLYPPPPKGGKKQDAVISLSTTPPVLALAKEVNKPPAQVLLRWGLQKNCVLIPKTSCKERMIENSEIFEFSLTNDQIQKLEDELQQALREAAEREGKDVQFMARLCWRNDPLRDLDFE